MVKIPRNMSSTFYPSFIPIYGYRVSGVSPAAGLKSGQSNQKRNIRVHLGDRGERREKNLNNLCVLSDLCGEILLGTVSDFM